MAEETPATLSATFPSSTSSPVDDPSSFDLSDPVGWVLSAQCLVSLLLNAVVLTTYCKDARLRANGSTALLLNLVAADLGITLCGCPFAAVANFSGDWPFGEIGCTLYGFQGMLFGLASIISVAALQFDRYLIICRGEDAEVPSAFFSPFGGHRVLSTGVVWINAGFWASAPVFGWHRYGVESSGVSCTIDYRHNSISYVTWLAGVFFVSYVCPLVAMLFFEFSIRRLSSLISPENEPATAGSPSSSSGKTKGFGTSKTFIGLLTVFLVCWTPYAVLCIYAVFFDVDASVGLPAAKLPSIFAKMAPILNPLVYLATVDEVRNAVARQMGKPGKKEN